MVYYQKLADQNQLNMQRNFSKYFCVAGLLFSQQTLYNFWENILTFLSLGSDCHIFEMVQINWDLSCTLVDINKIFTCQDLLKKRDFGKFQRLDDFLEYKKMWHKKTYKSEKNKHFFSSTWCRKTQVELCTKSLVLSQSA